MARPNLADVTTIQGITTSGSLTTTLTPLVQNPGASNKVLKINSIIVPNSSGTVSGDVSIGYSGNAGAGSTSWVAFTITVPPDSTLVALGKDSPIYLEEDKFLVGSASADNVLQFIVSYEDIS